MATSPGEIDGGSQTLSRGLRALEIIGDAPSPMSVAAVSEHLGIHRSMGYRLVKTLEQHGFVDRTATGGLVIGTRVASLARNVAKSLQSAAAPELRAIAEELGMTAFLATYDGEAVVTLSTAEPRTIETTVAKKPGSRHSIDRGAPGRVIRSQVDPQHYPLQKYEYSQDEVIPGIASIAVPLMIPGEQPAALAVIFLPQEIDKDDIVAVLSAAAERIALSVGA